MPSKKQLRAENRELKGELLRSAEELALAREGLEQSRVTLDALNKVLDMANRSAHKLSEKVALDKKDYQEMKKKYPRWSIEIATRFDGYEPKIVKTFKRSFDDLNPELRGDIAVAKSLTEPDRFDWGLLETFKKTSADPRTYFSGTGTLLGSLTSDFGGGYFEVSTEGEPSITHLDKVRVETAEAYLVENNFVPATPEAGVRV